ncbi:hypothetical protein BDV95DRAFT_506410 [Massariosphaeria phaeospora]|uniref:SGS-domain-containing protein n=1 Tax=Massariosphaeria phaeospora TaxID=100035 RepID=A0A7C8M7G4_9PLEO|nr:hypothetical protein BDV95DRAFT_506410 [Massariosphaeria phaeospora]
MDEASQGAAALGASNYDDAVKHYTAALAHHPKAVDYYIKRSTAYQRSAKYPEALADAEVAVVLAHQRARRELIKNAQLRRGIALYFSERYADAEHVLGIVARLDDEEKTLQIWNMKVAAKLKALDEGDERGKLTAKDIPDVKVPEASSSKSEESKALPIRPAAPAAATKAVPTPADKIKHDWYQNNDKVVFTLLAKGVPKDKASVEIEQDSLSISFPIQDSASDYNYHLDPFFAKVDASTSTFRITPTKIEVTLTKATPGVKWHSLEGDRPAPASTSDTENTVPRPAVPAPKTNDAPPAYPTSSKTGAKNWDNLDLDPADEEVGDETSRFFKTLYKGASPEAQRAMMKSYSESGGTVLSTDWSKVGGARVVPEPPDGMKARKY